MSELIDRDVLNQLKDFIEEKFPGVVRTYLDNSASYIDAIEKGLNEGDAQKIVDAAHPLKSSSGNMGLKALYEACENIEAKASLVVSGEEAIESLQPMVSELMQLYDGSIELLKQEV